MSFAVIHRQDNMTYWQLYPLEATSFEDAKEEAGKQLIANLRRFQIGEAMLIQISASCDAMPFKLHEEATQDFVSKTAQVVEAVAILAAAKTALREAGQVVFAVTLEPEETGDELVEPTTTEASSEAPSRAKELE